MICKDTTIHDFNPFIRNLTDIATRKLVVSTTEVLEL